MKITAIKIDKDQLQLLDDTDLPNGIPIRFSFLCDGAFFLSNVTGTKQGNLLKDIPKNSNYKQLQQWEKIPNGKVFNLYYNLPWKKILIKVSIKSLGFLSLIYLLSFFIPIDLNLKFNSTAQETKEEITKTIQTNTPSPKKDTKQENIEGTKNTEVSSKNTLVTQENKPKDFTTQGWIALAILILTNMDWLGLNKLSFSLTNGLNFETFQEKLDRVGEGQEKNEKNIHKLISFLLKNSLNEQEWEILYDLYHKCLHKFEHTPNLAPSDHDPDKPENQFRRLRTLGLIVRKDGVKLEFPCPEMENKDINQFITLTEEAIMNIQFIGQVVEKDRC